MTIKKHVSIYYEDNETGFRYEYEPVNNDVEIRESGTVGYIVGYLVRDSDAQSPSEWDDKQDDIAFVHYHSDFCLKRDEIITKNDLASWYRQDFSDYADDEIGEIPDKIPQEKDYHIFPVSALIHSGVWLRLGNSGFAEDGGGWDTSHVGAVLVSRKQWPDEDKAHNAAKSLIDTWNQYLSGDVYGIVYEYYDENKNQIKEESCWGYYGYDDTKKEMIDGLKYHVEQLKKDATEKLHENQTVLQL